MTAENSDTHFAHELSECTVSAIFRRPDERVALEF